MDEQPGPRVSLAEAQRFTAVHEAGHAVLACLKRIFFTHAEILPEGDAAWGSEEPAAMGGVHHDWKLSLAITHLPNGKWAPTRHHRKTVEALVMYSVAGLVAEILLLGTHMDHSESDDLASLRCELDLVRKKVADGPGHQIEEDLFPWFREGQAFDEYLKDLMIRTRDLLTRYRSAIAAVAEALLERRRLSREEVERIVEANKPLPRR